MIKNEYDLLKTLAVLLVILGYITIIYKDSYEVLEILTTIIYIFHMPLFIALSGAIYQLGRNNNKYTQFFPFLKNKLRRILLPFLIVSIMFLTPSLVMLGMCDSITGCILNILTGGNCIKHLWFLPALLWIFLIVWILDYFKINTYLGFTGAIILAILCSTSSFDLHYFCISLAIQNLPYFILGMLLYKNNNFKHLNTSYGWAMLIIFTIGQKMTNILIIDNFFRIFLACSIIYILMQSAHRIMPISKRIKALEIILKNSFAIYLFHVIIIFLMHKTLCLPITVMILLTYTTAIIGSIAIAKILRIAKLQVIIGETY